MKNPSVRYQINVTERSLLVSPGQSKKLADIRKMFQADVPVETLRLPEQHLLTGLKPEVATELNKARKLIDDRIDEIMRSFPEGKKNRLFGFRFGSVAAVKAVSIKNAFKTLAIDNHQVKMKLLADLDYHGNDISVNLSGI